MRCCVIVPVKCVKCTDKTQVNVPAAIAVIGSKSKILHTCPPNAKYFEIIMPLIVKKYK